MQVGVDTGGTFTDLVTAAGDVRKVLSTPDDPARAIAAAIGDDTPALLAHGTTVATNALLERKGARTALITTRGFRDLLEIARQKRPALYDLLARKPVPLVPRHRRYEVAERVLADGRVRVPVDLAEVERVLADIEAPSEDGPVEALAICFLCAFLAPDHER
ncbi:MAG TPA: hydantoinase/oxoprolinase N-terminal domain-containing protein, partial [Acidimicrobiales bacterium]